MTESALSSVERVQQSLDTLGLDCRVVEMPDSTRTAPEAAAAVGCDVSQIVKTIVFRGKQSERAIVAVMSGANRVDEKKLKAIAGEPLGKADANFVRTQTGFAIGGVSPIGHLNPPRIYFDQDLKKHKEVWAAAGTPYRVMCLTPKDLDKISQSTYQDLAQ